MANNNPSAGSGTNNNGSDRLDLLVDQIGRLTEQIAQSNIAIATGFAETRANIERLGEKIDSGFAETRANIEKPGEKIDNGFPELKAISQAQQQDINRSIASPFKHRHFSLKYLTLLSTTTISQSLYPILQKR